MEISRKNQWVEEEEIPGNVGQCAKVRKGRDAARGRWKSTEHVNEVGCEQNSDKSASSSLICYSMSFHFEALFPKDP